MTVMRICGEEDDHIVNYDDCLTNYVDDYDVVMMRR